jgi:2-polyprenyl-3-methyl-5-hydroxy-6-metoxy-1,4-benzoquinol methylase
MFRMPKSSPLTDESFYQQEYVQGRTTDVPDTRMLEELKHTSFAPLGLDYSGYIQVLRAVGMHAGHTVYDYGASWGYGSWQFAHAGYDVLSYEISRPRARYAEQHLQCEVVAQPQSVPRPVDCFFASHVLEHLAVPASLWRIAEQVLRPEGVVVLFMPNGEPSREHRDPERYHQLWGRVHPLLLTSASVASMAARHKFDALAYSSPYDLEQIAAQRHGLLGGDELLVVARRQR